MLDSWRKKNHSRSATSIFLVSNRGEKKINWVSSCLLLVTEISRRLSPIISMTNTRKKIIEVCQSYQTVRSQSSLRTSTSSTPSIAYRSGFADEEWFLSRNEAMRTKHWKFNWQKYAHTRDLKECFKSCTHMFSCSTQLSNVSIISQDGNIAV